MRIRRIRLSNYRGIVEHEVLFPEGEDVTIVQGPNEVGKSCLTEAIDVLFDCRDDSRAMRVRSLQPVGRDVATEIELEARTGEYEFTYSKRYHKERMTELVVRAPAPESLTGREAHDRARELLEHTIDVALWKALRIHQGMAVSQANVGQSASLSAALDHAAGSGGGDADENESLFEAVTVEFQRYHTPTGREKKELSERRAEVQRVEERVATLAARVRDLDLDVARCAALGADLTRLAGREAQVAMESLRYREELAALAGLRDEVQATELRWEGARGACELARERLATRGAQLARLGELESALARVTVELAASENAHAAAREELAAAEETLRVLVGRESAARDTATAARVDYEHWSDRDELDELGKRKERVQRAREEAADAQALLATMRVTSEAVRRIQASYNQLLVTRAVLQSKSSNLRLEVLRELTLVVGGERIVLDEGDVRQDAITAPLHLELPGLLRISIEPGEDLAQVRRNLDLARNEYMSSCQAIGVDDLETALELLKQRQRAEAKIAERDRAVSIELGESWTDGLESRQETLRRRVFAYLRERAASGPMPADRETALTSLRSAEAALEALRGERERVSVATEAVRARCGELGRNVADLAGRARAVAADSAAVRAALAEARAREADEVLERELELALAREAELRALHERTRADLESRGPDALRERVAGSEAVLAVLRRELRDTENERTRVGARVVLLGEEGLAEKYDQAESERVHLLRELERLESRARAAALLFHTLRDRREDARRAYVRPLRERIENLGRIVFGADFQIELDEDLRVRSRTLFGRTLPFESLSTGAREQIGIIARLACAMIVAADGSGVPMILDDALGYSDPQRLREMGAVLTVAGRSLQVIVLTSSPDRYLHVGGAQVLRLS